MKMQLTIMNLEKKETPGVIYPYFYIYLLYLETIQQLHEHSCVGIEK